jgi:membrane-associated phospholipid phosphatase
VLSALDLGLLRQLRTRGHAPPLETAMLALTRAGEHGMLWYALAGLGAVLDRPRRPAYLRAARVVLAAYLANTAIKFAVGRPRPDLGDLPPLVPTFSGLSYPSAHSAMSFGAARVIGEALPAAPLYALATAMALSRPYVGVHYPSDVLAGAVLGDAMAKLTP